MIEYVLFFASAFNMIYYGLLLVLTDSIWKEHLYWPISGLIFLVLGIFLWEDSKEWKRFRRGMSIRIRAVFAYTCGLYISLVLVFAICLMIARFYSDDDQWDYLILLESSGQTDTLTSEDIDMLNAAIDYVSKSENASCRLVLAAYNLQDQHGEYSEEIQYLMQDYLMKRGIAGDRMIIRKISNSLRKNIRNSYAYILVDWFQKEPLVDDEPEVAIMAASLSSLRYHLMLHNLGYHFAVYEYPEGILFWPSRIMAELVETISCHLTNQYQYD